MLTLSYLLAVFLSTLLSRAYCQPIYCLSSAYFIDTRALYEHFSTYELSLNGWRLLSVV